MPTHGSTAPDDDPNRSTQAAPEAEPDEDRDQHRCKHTNVLRRPATGPGVTNTFTGVGIRSSIIATKSGEAYRGEAYQAASNALFKC